MEDTGGELKLAGELGLLAISLSVRCRGLDMLGDETATNIQLFLYWNVNIGVLRRQPITSVDINNNNIAEKQNLRLGLGCICVVVAGTSLGRWILEVIELIEWVRGCCIVSLLLWLLALLLTTPFLESSGLGLFLLEL